MMGFRLALMFADERLSFCFSLLNRFQNLSRTEGPVQAINGNQLPLC